MRNIDDIKRSISRTVVISFIVVFLLSIIAMFLTHNKINAKAKILNQQQIQNIIHNYRSNLSEKLAIIASSNVFIDYIRSGEVSRQKILPEFLYQIRSLHSTSISGMMIDSDQSEHIFEDGIKTPYQVVLKLCYLNTTLDNNMGSCGYSWTLFFDKANLLNSFKNYDKDITDCKRCKNIDLLSGSQFGTFNILSHTPMYAGIEYSGRLDNSFYFYGFTITLTLIAFALWNRFRLKVTFEKYIATPIENITSKIRRGEKIGHQKEEIYEFSYLIDQVENWRDELNTSKKREKDVEIGKLLSQLLHDIRSPVTAIKTIVDYLPEVDEQKRQVIQHSVDTLNDLANKVLGMVQGKINNQIISHHEPEPIAMLLDRLISEKRSQLAGKNVDLSLEISPNAHGLFVNVDLIEFKRTLANLINNAIEAVEGNKITKEVKTYLSSLENNRAQIIVADNGFGISPELLPKILQGGTTSKKEGHGMGVSSAKKSVESWGGTFTIESKEGAGAEVIITLPLAKEAAWFASRVTVFQGSIVAILDDDPAIHCIWAERFKADVSPLDHIQLKQFSDPKAVIEFAMEHARESLLYLIDYELLNSEMNGLDVIEQLNIANQAYLVTSRYESSDVRTRAQKLKVKILPKNYAPYTPIRVISQNPDGVFLDDSKEMTFVWKLEAEKKGKRLETFNDILFFKEYVKRCKKDVLIYIDSELQSEQKGEDIAKELSEIGYSNIFIATGHPAQNFQHVIWVRGVISKDPPF